MQDAKSAFVATADQGLRGKKVIQLKQICDDAMAQCPFIKACFVSRQTGAEVNMQEGRDVLMQDVMPGMRPYCPPEPIDSEDLLFMLYTSGSTGKPKGVAHCTAGYLLWTSLIVRTIFDLHVGD